jgi:GNAT superfamily N-acetyltransferase
MVTSIRTGYTPGCIGRVAQLHANYYAVTSGFGVTFEAKVARELADFCQNFEPARDGLWLIDCDGSMEGSIAIDGTKADSEGAHLRWFITSDVVQGQGFGKRLLREALQFVDAHGYPSTHLATFAGLGAARHLYESHGFRLVHESPGQQWGTVVTEQRFVREKCF